MEKKLWISVKSPDDGKLRHKLIVACKVVAVLTKSWSLSRRHHYILTIPGTSIEEFYYYIKDAKTRAEFHCKGKN